jgi:dTDP-glucose 4,6-dehydratase
MRVVVTGGSGFLASHLCDALVNRGDSVLALDNFSTGRAVNVNHLLCQNPAEIFELVAADVCNGLNVEGPVDVVVHAASPASPPAYTALAIETLRVGSLGTENALRLAEQKHARFILTSTSEVYGDPLEHPQLESYWGNVNPNGLRSCYDESKRFAEAMTAAYSRYGPRMAADDGRVVSNFITQALAGRPLTVYGGDQTRSFCYVSDTVDGLIKLIDSRITGPVNIGNPSEFRIWTLAQEIIRLTGASMDTVSSRVPSDDPRRRCPDISMAARALDWRPKVDLTLGLTQTIEWFKNN